MRKWILAAGLMAARMAVQAQVEYKLTNFAMRPTGTTGGLRKISAGMWVGQIDRRA